MLGERGQLPVTVKALLAEAPAGQGLGGKGQGEQQWAVRS